MPKTRTCILVKPAVREYAGYRTELLTDLAFARLPQLIVHKGQADGPYDYLVVTRQGQGFIVLVRCFSSLEQMLGDASLIHELRFDLPTDLVNTARHSPSPVILFLWDADTEHGRYARLDQLPEPGDQEQVEIRFPRAATITGKNMEHLIRSFQAEAKQPIVGTAS